MNLINNCEFLRSNIHIFSRLHRAIGILCKLSQLSRARWLYCKKKLNVASVWLRVDRKRAWFKSPIRNKITKREGRPVVTWLEKRLKVDLDWERSVFCSKFRGKKKQRRTGNTSARPWSHERACESVSLSYVRTLASCSFPTEHFRAK